MNRWSVPWFLLLLLIFLVNAASAASTVTLTVEGMT